MQLSHVETNMRFIVCIAAGCPEQEISGNQFRSTDLCAVTPEAIAIAAGIPYTGLTHEP